MGIDFGLLNALAVECQDPAVMAQRDIVQAEDRETLAAWQQQE